MKKTQDQVAPCGHHLAALARFTVTPDNGGGDMKIQVSCKVRAPTISCLPVLPYFICIDTVHAGKSGAGLLYVRSGRQQYRANIAQAAVQAFQHRGM